MTIQLPRVEVVLNPSSGARLAPAFFDRTLEPLLRSLGLAHRLWQTEHEGDGERVGRELAATVRSEGQVQAVVLVLGGDGSSYELINGIFAPAASSGAPSPPFVLDLVPLPLGTANALYSHIHHRPAKPDEESEDGVEPIGSQAASLWWRHHLPKGTTEEDEARLASFGAWLDGQRRPEDSNRRRARLPLTRTTFHPAPTDDDHAAGSSAQSSPPSVLKPTLSHIVLSLALHAALLHLSEALRETEPGIERFKRAAEQVMHVRHEGALTFPANGATTTRWNPRRHSFEPISAATVEGPFAYVLSTPFVARLEPSFLIAPLLAGLAPSDVGRSMDVVVLRPNRSEAVVGGGQDAWVARVKEILGGAYQGGKHVEALLHDPIAGDEGGPAVLEYYRTPGFTFEPALSAAIRAKEPASADEVRLGRLVCADGAIFECPPGGYIEVCVLGPEDAGRNGVGEVWVWV